jgi:hypothetical protein
MRWVGFEPTIPMLEQAKILHVLGGAVTVIDSPNTAQDLIKRNEESEDVYSTSW